MTNSMTVWGSGERRPLLTPWRREALRTTLWVVPTAMVAAAILLFGVTYGLDRAIANGRMSLPGWAIAGEADASRQVDRHRRSRHHRRRRDVLDHDPGAAARVTAVRAPHAAELHPRYRDPGEPRCLRGDVRL